MKRIIAWGLAGPLLAIVGTLALSACGGDTPTSDRNDEDDVDGGIEFIRATDPETDREYVCLWKYEVGVNKAGGGLWCEPMSP